MANNSLALDLDLFDTAKSGYVPEYEEEKKIVLPKVVGEEHESPEKIRRDTKISRAAAVRACAFAFAVFIVIGSLLCARAVLTDAQAELSEAKAELSTAQSDYTTLQMKFNTLLAPEKIEEYAVNELGMVKRENYQIRYFDLSGKGGAQLTQ